MIAVKPGVQPRLVHLMAAVANVSERLNLTLTVTSAMDSIHAPDSLHYALRAVDLRTHGLTEAQVSTVMGQIKADMGPTCDVIWEGRGTPNSHLHVEWDPA